MPEQMENPFIYMLEKFEIGQSAHPCKAPMADKSLEVLG